MNHQFTAIRATRRAGMAWSLLLVGLSLALAGCGTSGAPTAVEVTPTISSTVSLTETPVSTRTLTPPTETAEPTRTPTLAPPSATSAPTANGPGFAADVQPILVKRCIKCHSGERPPRGLRLDSYEHIMAGGSNRPELIPGNPAESEIVRRIKGTAMPRMPFDGPPFLSDEDIAIIEAWIAAGALDN